MIYFLWTMGTMINDISRIINDHVSLTHEKDIADFLPKK